MVILVSPEHPKKTAPSIFVTEFGMVTLVRLEQFENVEVFDCQLYAVNTIEK